MTEVLTLQNSSKAKDNFWQEALSQLKHFLGLPVYKTWISHLQFDSVITNVLVLNAPNSLVSNWVLNTYQKDIIKISRSFNPAISSLKIEISPSPLANSQSDKSVDVLTREQNQLKIEDPAEKVLQLELFNDQSLSLPTDQRYTFETFIPHESNQSAQMLAKSVAQGKIHQINGIRSLLIEGSVGNGKTHLLHSIYNYCRENRKKLNCCYISAERFVFQYVKSVRSNSLSSFKEAIRSFDVILIDDFHFIAGKTSSIEEMQHLFTYFTQCVKTVVIASAKPIEEITGLGKDFINKIKYGATVKIGKPNQDLYKSIIKDKALRIGIDLDEESINYMANNAPCSIREMEGIINKLAIIKSIYNKPISFDVINDLMVNSGVIAQNESLSINSVQKRVAQYFCIDASELSSSSRRQEIVQKRQLAMYISSVMAGKSLIEIGKAFGNRSHSTVIHSIQKITQDLENNKLLAQQLQEMGFTTYAA